MLRILLHIAFIPAIIALQRRMGYRKPPALLALAWFAAGIPFMLAETAAVTGTPFAPLFLEEAVVALFYVPAAWLAFRHVAWRKAGPVEGTVVFLVLAALVTVAVSLLLAQAPSVRGFGV